MGRAVPGLRRLEHVERDSDRRCAAALGCGPGGHAAGGTSRRCRSASPYRIRRIRPRAGRRARARRRHAAGRRPGGRQIDPVATGVFAPDAEPWRLLRDGRGIAAPDRAALVAARVGHEPACRYLARKRAGAGARVRSAGAHHRFDPDHDLRRGPFGTRFRGAVKGGSRPHRAVCETERGRCVHHRACHQGGRDRRSPGGRTHGRYGPVLRERSVEPLHNDPLREKPFRRQRRDGRVRHDRDRFPRSQQPVGNLPVARVDRRAGQYRVRCMGGESVAARRDPGPRRG